MTGKYRVNQDTLPNKLSDLLPVWLFVLLDDESATSSTMIRREQWQDEDSQPNPDQAVLKHSEFALDCWFSRIYVCNLIDELLYVGWPFVWSRMCQGSLYLDCLSPLSGPFECDALRA
ncbi:hypothetical protein CC2G_000195 [Coprinopsis cinerea AmutBmut pab1-1]|nr:hypothetical protein CC2G_000195 [Coprinopsis cinerea AmutBmut pab1-1]